MQPCLIAVPALKLTGSGLGVERLIQHCLGVNRACRAGREAEAASHCATPDGHALWSSAVHALAHTSARNTPPSHGTLTVGCGFEEELVKVHACSPGTLVMVGFRIAVM